MLLAERVGFEPTERNYRSRALQARALGQTMLPLQTGLSCLPHKIIAMPSGWVNMQ